MEALLIKYISTGSDVALIGMFFYFKNILATFDRRVLAVELNLDHLKESKA